MIHHAPHDAHPPQHLHHHHRRHHRHHHRHHHHHRNLVQRLVVALARKQLGKPYVYGTQGPRTFDCSGLVDYVYEKAHHGFGRMTAWMLSRVGKPVYGRLHPGDIIVVDGGHHVVLYVGHGRVIHAPHSGSNVHYAPVNEYLRREYAIRRVVPWV